MEKENKLSPALDRKNQRKQRNDPNTASSKSLESNPRVTQRVLQRSGSSSSPYLQGSRGPSSRGRGYNGSHPVRDTSGNLLQRDRSSGDPQAKTRKSNNDSRHREPVESKRKGFRSTRSAPSPPGKPKQTQAISAMFEVKMIEFPELSGASPSKAAPPVSQTGCWGPSPLSKNSKAPQPLPSSKSQRRGSSTQPELQPSATDVKSEASLVPPAQTVVASWANIASQPPKKPVPRDKTISNNHVEMEGVSEKQEEGVAMNKKRKKKKKAKGTAVDVNVEIEEPPIPQEPPKFEDEEEFPVLTPALSRPNRLPPSSSMKLCNEGIQRESGQQPPSNQNTDKPQTENNQSTEGTKKGQKAEKVSGKKSKVPVQLDIGNMLATLEKKQQSQKTKQDSKPLIFSVGGGLPVVHKLQPAPKKTPWQQDKIAHNPLDSTSPLVKKGKQREVPKAKKPTPLKRVILKEREERKQRRLLEERGLLPEEVSKPPNDVTEEEEQCDANTPTSDEVEGPTEEFEHVENLNDTGQITQDGAEETEMHENGQQQVVTSTESHSVDTRKIHSRKFREYCSQMLSKDVDECVTTLLKELVRFQDRLYQKDPMKARMKRRIVMGLREVLKHLKLRKVKCVIISPNCERIQSKGGLDEALHTIIDTCREQDVPFVFALSRKALGRCLNKVVPVSLVGIFNYDGAQDFYHKMIELSSEARKAYDVMVSGLTAEQEAGAEQRPDDDSTLPEESECMKVWKKMLEKSSNHAFLNFEEQLSSLHLNSECTENSDEGERS